MNQRESAPMILIVDDDQEICGLADRVLKRGGYRAIAVSEVSEALAVVEQSGGDVDLILADLLMPDVGGVGLQASLRERGLDIPVVFMSGGGVTPRTDPLRHLLPKPWTAAQLLRFVEQALPEPHRPSGKPGEAS